MKHKGITKEGGNRETAKEKKDFRLMEKEKTLATYQSLGEEEILERSNQELIP
jgi:hypothetical protein